MNYLFLDFYRSTLVNVLVSSFRYSFEGLDVWHLSRQLVLDIYRLTECFPAQEMYGLTGQLRRASVSVASNIAEGSARRNRKDQGHFYQIAYSSLMEVACQMVLSVDLGFLDQETHEALKPEINKISNKLNALYRHCQG